MSRHDPRVPGMALLGPGRARVCTRILFSDLNPGCAHDAFRDSGPGRRSAGGGQRACAVARHRPSDAVLRRFNSGAGADAVGMVDASEDTEIAGPQAIYAGEGERGLPARPGRTAACSASITQAAGRADAARSGSPKRCSRPIWSCGKGEIFVWDGSVRALQADRTGRRSDARTREYQTRAIDDPFTVSAFAQMGSQRPGEEADLQRRPRAACRNSSRAARRRSNTSIRAGAVRSSRTSCPMPTRPARSIEVQPQGQAGTLAKLQVQVRDRLGALEFLEIDRQGRMFVLGENIPLAGRAPSAFVARFAAGGKLEGIYELPLSQSVALSRRFVTVSEHGRRLLPAHADRHRSMCSASASGRCAPRSSTRAGSRHPRTRPEAKTGKGPIAATLPLSRQRVIETAFAFEGIRWPLTQTAYGGDPDSACTGFNRIRRPSYLHGKLGQEVRGIPYCWGCHGALAQIRDQDQSRHDGRQCLHPQCAAPGRRRSRLLGVRQRGLGTCHPFHHHGDPVDHASGWKIRGICCRATRSTSQART